MDQRVDNRLDLVAVLGDRQLFGGAGQGVVIAGRHSKGVVDQGHHVVDFADHACADLVDTIGGLDVRQIGLVDLFEIGFGQPAVARQRLVDDLVERRVIAGRVDVPDLIVARDGGLPERFDLGKRNFRESHCAFVFVEHLDHGSRPQ